MNTYKYNVGDKVALKADKLARAGVVVAVNDENEPTVEWANGSFVNYGPWQVFLLEAAQDIPLD